MSDFLKQKADNAGTREGVIAAGLFTVSQFILNFPLGLLLSSSLWTLCYGLGPSILLGDQLSKKSIYIC